MKRVAFLLVATMAAAACSDVSAPTSSLSGTALASAGVSEDLSLLASLCPPSKIRFTDPFSGPAIGVAWHPVSGTWSQSGGLLSGDWPLGNAHGEQANLLLDASVHTPGSYVAGFTLNPTLVEGKLVLYVDSGNKYNLNFGNEFTPSGGYVGVEYKLAGSNYQQLVYINQPSAFHSRVNDVVGARQTGNLIELFVNNQLVYSFVDTVFGGAGQLGLGSYGTMSYTAFRTCDL